MVNSGGTLTEAFISEGDWTPLGEAAVGDDGTISVKIIGPGWSRNGRYYSESLLREGAGRYTAGTKDFWNHPGNAKLKEQPSGDLNELASVLIEDARYLDEGDEGAFKGAGLYARVRPFGDYRDRIVEMAPWIGMSHRVNGKQKMGEAEGRRGMLVESIDDVVSVDYVATPAAGGAVMAEGDDGETVALAEAKEVIGGVSFEDQMRIVSDALGKRFSSGDMRAWAMLTYPDKVVYRAPDTGDLRIVTYSTRDDGAIEFGEPAAVEQVYRMKEGEETDMAELTEAEKALALKEAALAESEAKVAALEAERDDLKNKATLAEASGILAEELAKSALPDAAKERIAVAVVGESFDAAAYRTAVVEAIATEAAYVAAVAGTQKREGTGVAFAEADGALAIVRELRQATGRV